MKYRARVVGVANVRPALTLDGGISGTRVELRDEGLLFRGSTIQHADLSGSRLRGFDSVASRFEHCDFSNVVFATDYESSFGTRSQSMFIDCTFDRADLRHTDVGQARFERCSFRNAKIVDWRSEAGEFIDCVFAGPLREAIFYGHPPDVPWKTERWLLPYRPSNEVRGNDFRKADLILCEFRNGVDLDAQLLPSGEQYVRLDRRIERFDCARQAVMGWPESEQRREAEIAITIFGRPEFNQEDWFVRREDLGSHGAVDALIDILLGC